ncbi:hypothetical protein KTH71_04220 [Acinetobacter sp. WU_MDCI_Axc73]|nr:hypothetical protein [Acinetobacter sp. WU_MDCI_Axc73]
MKKLLLGLVVVVGLIGCSDKKYNSCVEKGIQYYKDIDSYPKLKSENINADDKVKQICKNSPVAFD